MTAAPAHAEKALLEPDLTCAAAGGADLGLGSRFCAAAAATIATLLIGDFDLVFNTEGRFFKGDLHGVLQVVAASAATPLSSATENVPEYVAEYVSKRRTRAETPAVKATSSTQPGMAELIVLGAFLGIGEDFVRLGDLLEPFFRRIVSGILVRVVLNGHFAECLLDLNLGGITVDT
jgi:hypothetical protein